jgi:hypothetical protein
VGPVAAVTMAAGWGRGGWRGQRRSGAEWSGVERTKRTIQADEAEWSGVERSGAEWSGVERSGAEWSGVERSGAEWSGVERSQAELCSVNTLFPSQPTHAKQPTS